MCAMKYRFTSPEGGLTGQSFGNLLLAALNGIFPTFDQAVAGMQHVLAITGQVLPVTTADVRLEALFEDGSVVLGESNISQCKDRQCRIRQIRLIPDSPPALPAVLEAIENADLILLGPGSLYTSIIPNLLVGGVADAICRSGALKLYICNIMTQDGETDGYTVADHIAALQAHGGPELFRLCLVNSSALPAGLVNRYLEEHSAPVLLDPDQVRALGVEVVAAPMVAQTTDFAHHDPKLLTRAIREIYEDRAMRVFPQAASAWYILEGDSDGASKTPGR